MIEAEFTCHEADHMMEVSGIWIASGPSLGGLDVLVDAFAYAVLEFWGEVVDDTLTVEIDRYLHPTPEFAHGIG
jgi:hypothetical protein